MALKWFQQPAKKACVVGIDGVPHSMIMRFMDEGVMPRLRDISGLGVTTDMTVSLPEISSVSWSTFMTGKNPGEHGIFGFTDLHAGTYKMSFPSFRDVKCETIWDRIGKAQMRSVVINQPATYPARPMHGALVSGFVAVQLEKSIFPARYLKNARALSYEIDLDAGAVRDDPPALFRALHELLESRRRMLDLLWKEEKWNLMEVIVTGTDRLHHFMWDAYENPDHAHHGDFLDYYRAVDAFIGDVHDRFVDEGGGDNFFVLSDHGFCGTRKEAYLNHALAENGFLKMTGPEAADLADISESSRAFVLDPARIYVHKRGKYPRGSVGAADVKSIKDEIRALLGSLTDDGQPIVRYIFDGEEVYSGPQSQHGPDLLVVPHNGFDFKGRIGAPALTGPRRLQGMHTWDDAYFFTKRQDLMTDSADFTLVEIPGKILQSLDVDPE